MQIGRPTPAPSVNIQKFFAALIICCESVYLQPLKRHPPASELSSLAFYNKGRDDSSEMRAFFTRRMRDSHSWRLSRQTSQLVCLVAAPPNEGPAVIEHLQLLFRQQPWLICAICVSGERPTTLLARWGYFYKMSVTFNNAIRPYIHLIHWPTHIVRQYFSGQFTWLETASK